MDIKELEKNPAYQLWLEIEEERTKFITATNVIQARAHFKKLKKLQKMYDVCVTDEMHREIINTIELRTRGF